MATTDSHEATAESARNSDQLLDFRNRLRANVEFRSGEEGFGPGVMQMVGGCAESEIGVELLQLPPQLASNREMLY